MKKAILVGVEKKDDEYDILYSLDELNNLANTLEIICVGQVIQKLDHPNPAFFVGKGKVEEIKNLINETNCEVVIFDDELTPSQNRNLQEELKIEVIDRSYLILQIFAKRAQTKSAMLEIKLANDYYLLPRISFLREQESRSGGSSGYLSSKGSGETQKELDRRHIMAEITQIKKQINQIHNMRTSQIEKRKRNNLPIVALVGYTNAGKSTTMNTILKNTGAKDEKNVLSKDELFATLNTSNRLITYKKLDFLLVDTIGFVSKLPHHLINSFTSTLEEIKHADLIIHVVDISSRYYINQIEITNNVLKKLGCDNIPMIYLLNKYDLYIDNNTKIVGVENIPFSNKNNLNVEKLLNSIYNKIQPRMFECKVIIPYSDGKIANFIEENATILSKLYLDKGILYDISINSIYYKHIANYEIDSNVS